MKTKILPKKQELSLNVILIRDSTGPGFTGFFAEFPEVIAEGATEEETEKNLLDTLIVALDYKRHKMLQKEDMLSGGIITKQLKFSEA